MTPTTVSTSSLQTLRWLVVAIVVACPRAAADTWRVQQYADQGRVEILLDGQQFATYSYCNPDIPRPYFANIFVPGGLKITRNHPPADGDLQDHDKIHTGIWLAFGDISGHDYWRLKAPIEHVRFVVEPRNDGNTLRLAVENRYLTEQGDSEVCREICNYGLHRVRHGVLLVSSSEFRSESNSFYFGDQEEMGLGVRLATPIAVSSGQGGRILNSQGKVNQRQAWGTSADWCDYSGSLAGKYVGMMIMPHPHNIRRSWCHARDWGFMAMNPFGRNAFTGGEVSKVFVHPGESFMLRYGLLIHWHDRPGAFDPAEAYQHFLRLAGESP